MDLDPCLYLSSSYVRAKHIGDALATLVGQGITQIELTGGTQPSDGILPTLIRMRDDYDLRYQVHNYFPPEPQGIVLNIAAPDPRERAESHDFVRRSLDWVVELGLSLYSVHAGFLGSMSAGGGGELFQPGGGRRLSRRDGSKALVEATAELAEAARSRGVRLAVENQFPLHEGGEDLSLLRGPDDVFEFLEAFRDTDDVGLLLDLGHLHITAQRMGLAEQPFLRELVRSWQYKLFAIHISHNNGNRDDHLAIPPDSWVFDRLDALRPRRVITSLEIRRGTIDQVRSSLAMISSRLARHAEPVAPR